MALVPFNIDPVSRIEGHLKVFVEVDDATGLVNDVRCESKLFRGIENILKRRDPRDAPVICQRI
jgi:Ni,Fe-hydrogenase I large subunit